MCKTCKHSLEKTDQALETKSEVDYFQKIKEFEMKHNVTLDFAHTIEFLIKSYPFVLNCLTDNIRKSLLRLKDQNVVFWNKTINFKKNITQIIKSRFPGIVCMNFISKVMRKWEGEGSLGITKDILKLHRETVSNPDIFINFWETIQTNRKSSESRSITESKMVFIFCFEILKLVQVEIVQIFSPFLAEQSISKFGLDLPFLKRNKLRELLTVEDNLMAQYYSSEIKSQNHFKNIQKFKLDITKDDLSLRENILDSFQSNELMSGLVLKDSLANLFDPQFRNKKHFLWQNFSNLDQNISRIESFDEDQCLLREYAQETQRVTQELKLQKNNFEDNDFTFALKETNLMIEDFKVIRIEDSTPAARHKLTFEPLVPQPNKDIPEKIKNNYKQFKKVKMSKVKLNKFKPVHYVAVPEPQIDIESQSEDAQKDFLNDFYPTCLSSLIKDISPDKVQKFDFEDKNEISNIEKKKQSIGKRNANEFGKFSQNYQNK